MSDKVQFPQFRCSFCLEIITNFWVPDRDDPSVGYWNSGRTWMAVSPTFVASDGHFVLWYTACSFCLRISEDLGRENTIFDFFHTSLPTASLAVSRDEVIETFKALSEHAVLGKYLKADIYSWSALEKHLNMVGEGVNYV